MYLCPHCSKPGVSVLRRAFLGPAIAATCSSCGGKVGVPWGKSMIALSPFLLAILGSAFAPSFAAAAAIWVAGAVVMFVLFFTFVPLVKE